jgi:hypothetical protein
VSTAVSKRKVVEVLNGNDVQTVSKHAFYIFRTSLAKMITYGRHKSVTAKPIALHA